MENFVAKTNGSAFRGMRRLVILLTKSIESTIAMGPVLLSEQVVRLSISFFLRRVAISELLTRALAACILSTCQHLVCQVRILARRTIDMI